MIRSNALSDMWPTMMTADSATGLSCGKTTWRYICQVEEPSMRAASRSSSGTPRKPARNRAIT